MNYVRSISGSVSKTWNSINPATLSGAIDVVVIEQEDGSLSCSPFHVRFGKFSLLRPYEKKVEFVVNNVKQSYSMKLGEGGEAFFIFETLDDIPEGLQTSPLVSPATSPQNVATSGSNTPTLQEPDFFNLDTSDKRQDGVDDNMASVPILSQGNRALTDLGSFTPLSQSPNEESSGRNWEQKSLKTPPFDRSVSDQIVHAPGPLRPLSEANMQKTIGNPALSEAEKSHQSKSPPIPAIERPESPPALSLTGAIDRAKSLSQKLLSSNIPSQVTESGDLKLDMTGFKTNDTDVLRAEVIARKLLAAELEGNYDIGALIGADENGNLWIYSSEEAKEAAGRNADLRQFQADAMLTSDSASDPGYHSDSEKSHTIPELSPPQRRRESDAAAASLMTPPQTPPDVATAGDPNRNYAKTLRLTSEQLKDLKLKPGANAMSFTVNRSTCQAHMFYWKHDVPIVISDIDGTITKSDTLGHVLNMIGRDWTHAGVAKLYTDIAANGFHILYLTSRSVGQADTTRGYLKGVVQEEYRLPDGPVIMSPDRTYAALRREVYLRKPEVFKMSCLRDILHLFNPGRNPFYAGFGNRLTDALSYRSVNIPLNRIFTINSNAEVSMELLSLKSYKSSYVTIREIVDHYFPPVGLLINGGGEEFTDFNYWRNNPLELDDFSASESEDDEDDQRDDQSVRSEDEGSDGAGEDERDGDMAESFLSQESTLGEDETRIEASLAESLVIDESSSVANESRDNSLDMQHPTQEQGKAGESLGTTEET
ncbi:MAG: Nuclear elongation and deformation protein 1 [Vezdaea aestivalis]|nr:MAG: Nuclear elongation and deformation protein 1 [Vezdaea aestivalis]